MSVEQPGQWWNLANWFTVKQDLSRGWKTEVKMFLKVSEEKDKHQYHTVKCKQTDSHNSYCMKIWFDWPESQNGFKNLSFHTMLRDRTKRFPF